MTTHRPIDPAGHGTVLVLGGTGKTGRRVARGLRARGMPVRAVGRASDPAFAWGERGTWDGALDGVGAAYISYAPDLAVPGAVDTVRAFIDHALVRGVQRLVLLSGRGESEAQACERVLQDSGADWTIVRASWFDQNFSEGEFAGMVRDGAIALPAGAIPEPFVDADDIAQVAVAALTETGHVGELYEVTGPRLLTFDDVARELARATGREVAFTPIPRAVFAEAIAASGAPRDIAWLLDYLFGTVLDGRNAYTCDGVERALGRPPTDFAEFARRAAAAGAWDTREREATA
jgi:uncharacterized protein YbjT (DUF2867 family)